jgi:hypothetical protein
MDTLDQYYASFVRLATEFVKDPSCVVLVEHQPGYSGTCQCDIY